MKSKNTVLVVISAIVLCVTLFLTLNAFTIAGIFNESAVKKSVSSESFVKALVLETTGGLTSTPGEDAIILDDSADTEKYMQILDERQRLGLVIDDVIVAGLRTETISEAFSKVAVSCAKSKILGEKFDPLTEQQVTALSDKLNSELENFDTKILPESVAQNISLDFKYNPHKLSSETNDYLTKAFESATVINGAVSFGYNIPFVWAIISAVIIAAVILLTINNKSGLGVCGISLGIASALILGFRSTYISLFGTNSIVKKAVVPLVNKTVFTVFGIALIVAIILIAVSVILYVKESKHRKNRRHRHNSTRTIDL